MYTISGCKKKEIIIIIFHLNKQIQMALPKQSMVWSPVRPQAEWNQSVRKAKNWEETNIFSMLAGELVCCEHRKLDILLN